MQKVLLTQGKFALVDDEDYELVREDRWCAYRSANTKSNFRVQRNAPMVNGKRQTPIYMPHFLLEQNGIKVPKGMVVDHINGDGLDNQRSINLHVATLSQNQFNRRKQSKPASSRFIGVCWDKRVGKWLARIAADRKVKFLGNFDTEHAAYKAYLKAKEQYHRAA